MDELIIRHLRGLASDVEARQVERWRAASPDNERRFLAARDVWALTADLAHAPAEAPQPPALDTILVEADRRRRGWRGRSLLGSPWAGYGLAAAAVAALTFFMVARGPAPTTAPLVVPVESTAGRSDVMTMSLSDGSVIRLGRSSSVEFPPVEGRRQVLLRGRAFFAVTPDEAPFVVDTRDGQVTVHGTRFEMRQDDNGLRVVVVEGVVRLEAGGSGVDVAAGSVALVAPGEAPQVVGEADVWSLLEWDGGLLVFQETPLGQVAAELARHFDRPVALADPALASVRITAWFGDEPLDDVVSAVCLVAGVRCTAEGGGVTLGR